MKRPVVFPTLLLTLLPLPMAGQRIAARTTIIGEPSCDSCRLEVEQVARLGGDPQGYIIGITGRVFLDSRDRWFVLETVKPAEVKVYDSDGTFLRLLGREGQGPGEFRRVSYVQEYPTDTLNIYDRGNGRISRFTADFQYIDQRPLRLSPLYLLFTKTGRLVVNTPYAGDPGNRLPLHFVGPEGTVVQSFGREIAAYRNGGENHHIRVIAPGKEGGVWAASLGRYEIEYWDDDGKLGQIVERVVQWFPPHRDPATRTNPRSGSPNPRLRALWVDKDGLLWTAVDIPQDDWREGFYPYRLQSGLVFDKPLKDEHYDSRIEVLDPLRGVALATVTVPEAVTGFVGNPNGEVFLYHLYESPDFEPYIDLWRMRLVGPSKPIGGKK